MTYRHNAAAAASIVDEVCAAGLHAEAHALDLAAGPEATGAVVDAAAASLGGLDAVILAAGPDLPQPRVRDVRPDQWAATVTADLTAALAVTQAALPHLRASAGALVALSSAGVRRAPPGDVLSVVPKAGLEALFRTVAREEGRNGVRANCVAVGVADAGQFHRLVASGELDEAWLTAARRNIPLRRFATATEIAAAVAFLASRDAAYITGQTLTVDGGYTA